LIITPMLDMSFQILAFFIMTYHPSALEGHFDIKLLPPKTVATKGAPSTNELPPASEEPELNDVLLVTVKAVAKGQSESGRLEGDPSRILLTRPEDASNPVPLEDTNDKFPGLTRLGTELKKFLADPGHSNANIKIEPDGELKHKYAMQVYDACKRVRQRPDGSWEGFQNIQFVGPAYEAKK
jgi:biopolymer transport protein ExbD